jgi:transposase
MRKIRGKGVSDFTLGSHDFCCSMDNLPAHKSPVAKKAILDKGARVLFLPPCSPDLNPIEMAFAKLKAHLRARAVRTIDALWKAIGQICDLFQPQECKKLFQRRRIWIQLNIRRSRAAPTIARLNVFVVSLICFVRSECAKRAHTNEHFSRLPHSLALLEPRGLLALSFLKLAAKLPPRGAARRSLDGGTDLV